jgi:hypothetical protein
MTGSSLTGSSLTGSPRHAQNPDHPRHAADVAVSASAEWTLTRYPSTKAGGALRIVRDHARAGVG